MRYRHAILFFTVSAMCYLSVLSSPQNINIPIATPLLHHQVITKTFRNIQQNRHFLYAHTDNMKCGDKNATPDTAGIDTLYRIMDISKRVRERLKECRRRIFVEKDLSTEIKRILNKNISDLRSINRPFRICYNLEMLADYHFLAGDNTTGASYLKQALSAAQESGNLRAVTHLYGKLGAYHARMGKIELAERNYSNSIKMAEKTEDPYNISRSYSFMATLRASEGFFVEAESLHTKAIGYSRATGDTLCEANRILALARLYKSFGEIERALHLTDRIILLTDNYRRQKLRYKNRPRKENELNQCTASALNLLSEIQLMKNQPEDALKNMKKSLSTGKKTIDRHVILKLEIYLADIYTKLGKWKEAEKYYKIAIQETENLGERRRTAEYITAMAKMYQEIGKYHKAQRLLNNALEISVDENYWMQEIESAYLAGKVAVSLNNAKRAKSYFRRALGVFKRMANIENFFASRHPMWQILNELFNAIYKLECNYFNNSDSLLYYSEIYKHLYGIGADHKRHPSFSCLAKLLDKREWIAENSLLVEHLLLEDKIIILGTDRNQVFHRTVQISPEEVESRVLNFYHVCSSTMEKSGLDNPGDRVNLRAMELYEMLLEPISAFIDKKERIILVEDGILEYLPFHALIPTDKPNQFLVETKEIVYSPRIIPYRWPCKSLLPKQSPDKHSIEDTGQVKAGFDNNSSELLSLKSPLIVGDIVIATGLKKLYPHLSELPSSINEIDIISKLLSTNNILRGRAANKRKVREIMQNSDIIHIATHTINYPVYGGRTALVVSPEKEIHGEKELATTLLTIEDIQTLKLDRSYLVILSSCESASGKPLMDIGKPDLAEAFLNARARLVIAPIWPVEDRVIKELCIQIYRELLSNTTDPVKALTSVQRRIIREEETNAMSSVWKWAPMTVSTTAERPTN
jgi:CHAT domain-containing protein/tetratricopeptide (TPR) repeat protein